MGLSVDIHKKLGDFTLDISFESNARRIGILGPSGCGKSMTLKCIAGIERPDKGRIVIDPDAARRDDAVRQSAHADGTTSSDTGNAAGAGQAKPGQPLHARTETANTAGAHRVLFDSPQKINLKPQKRNVGYMFQNYALFPTMTVAQNIAAGLKLSSGQRDDRVAEMVERFHLQGLEKHLPGELSGGQQQRVALARIMAYRPDLILLDEPFSALDQHLKERLQHEMLHMLEDYDGQVIMVSHSRDELYRFSEELLIMEDGGLLARGETLRLFDDPGTIAVARMTGCKNFSSAQRLDSHRLRLLDWGTDLQLQQEIPEGTVAIGYRAHFFEPVWGDRQENCIPFKLSGMDELPFERRYYIIPAGYAPAERSDPAAGSSQMAGFESAAGSSSHAADCDPAAGISPADAPKKTMAAPAGEELICWFVQDKERRALDENPMPDWLRLQENAVMLLRG